MSGASGRWQLARGHRAAPCRQAGPAVALRVLGHAERALLALALDRIPAAHLKLFFARLLRDVQANRTGFPDLVRFWPAERRYELVEAKAPGDKLQDNQIRWLQYCAEHGIPVRVCHVQWRGQPLGEAA